MSMQMAIEIALGITLWTVVVAKRHGKKMAVGIGLALAGAFTIAGGM